jgi:hypothetical protein
MTFLTFYVVNSTSIGVKAVSIELTNSFFTF